MLTAVLRVLIPKVSNIITSNKVSIITGKGKRARKMGEKIKWGLCARVFILGRGEGGGQGDERRGKGVQLSATPDVKMTFAICHLNSKLLGDLLELSPST